VGKWRGGGQAQIKAGESFSGLTKLSLNRRKDAAGNYDAIITALGSNIKVGDINLALR